ncbi:uncharacterized protein [Ambystoma mexicanum]|uniref:uncharacterized protein n=1 Tax=Ambystoma mexicanum TaxID=8296 RepID=UPI0037E76B4E
MTRYESTSSDTSGSGGEPDVHSSMLSEVERLSMVCIICKTDKEGKRLDTFGKRIITTVAATIKAVNAMAILTRYDLELWYKLGLLLEFLPEVKKQEALDIPHEGPEVRRKNCGGSADPKDAVKTGAPNLRRACQKTGCRLQAQMPFGLASASAVFHRGMQKLFVGIQGVEYFQDDILVCGRTRVEHDGMVLKVMKVLEASGLRVKLSKCKVGVPSVTYLGHTLDVKGIHPKVMAGVRGWRRATEISSAEGAGVVSRQSDRRNLFAERGCCKRLSHFVYIGRDISGSPVSIDIGMCRSHCGPTPRISTYSPGFPGLPKHSSMLDFLKTKKLRDRAPESALTSASEPSCPMGATCEPTKILLERVLLFHGIQEVEVTEDCQCNPVLEECIRMPALKAFFPDSPFETTVDVGKCSSPTETAGLFCSPTKFETVVVENPNGAELVQTVESCDMKASCYRVPYLQFYYETVYSTAGHKEERLKEIDVGRCLGSCSSGNHCLLRDSRNKDHCLIWAEGASHGCVSDEYETHVFRTRNGHMRTAFAIQTCKCQ